MTPKPRNINRQFFARFGRAVLVNFEQFEHRGSTVFNFWARRQPTLSSMGS